VVSGVYLRVYCVGGHAVVFVVDAALMASQWQYRGWSVSYTLTSTLNRELDMLQVPFFKIFGKTPPGIPPYQFSNLLHQFWWCLLNQLDHITGELYFLET